MAKLRQEQLAVRGTDASVSITLDMLDEMPYTRAVVKESLRLRPPVIMVPYTAKADFPITPDYTVPAGSMIIPSFWNSLHDPEVYPDPEDFVPERWLDGGSSVNSKPQNYVVFGAGPHKCIANEYAQMHIAAVISTAAMMMDWEHKVTPESHDIKIILTIYPKDGLWLKFKPRASS